MNDVTAPKRTYNLGRRAEAAEANAQRVVDALTDRMATQWFEDIRLDDVAADAGVTVQTILRRFGSKEGLLQAVCDRMDTKVRSRRASPTDDLAAMIRGVIADYEVSGDLLIHLLNQEDRHPPIKAMADIGRAGHRDWLAQTCAGWLDADDPEKLDALVVATDVFIWRLIRRDMGRPPEALERHMRRLVASALRIPLTAIPTPGAR